MMTKNLVLFFTAFLFLLLICSFADSKDTAGGVMLDQFTVVTFNLWHGLNPVGPAKFEEYESPAQREARLDNFLIQIRETKPDIIFLQEVNPAPGLTDKIAQALDFDGVYQVANAGLKIGSVGLPSNFRSGLAILARKELGLYKLGGQKLSGGFGGCGRFFSFQLSEFRYALAARVNINGQDILLANVHLHHGLEITPEILRGAEELISAGKVTRESWKKAVISARDAVSRRERELHALRSFLKSVRTKFNNVNEMPMLLAGDFNSTPGSKDLSAFIKSLALTSVTRDDGPDKAIYTWDPEKNRNTHMAADFLPSNPFEEFIRDHLKERVMMQRRKLDYIFYKGEDSFFSLRESGIFGNKAIKGKMASDHFGVFGKFDLLTDK